MIAIDQAVARTVAAITPERSDWVQKASRIGPNKDSPVDKKHKIADK